MARVTIYDCVERVANNRFELVALASFRAKNLANGEDPRISRNQDKHTVIALREIASGKVDIDNLRNTYIASLQKKEQIDRLEEVALDKDIKI